MLRHTYIGSKRGLFPKFTRYATQIRYYPFHTIGTTVRDMSGEGKNGLLVGGARQTQGIAGSAIYLDGVNDYISVTQMYADGMTDYFTVMMWLKLLKVPTAPDYTALVCSEGQLWAIMEATSFYCWVQDGVASPAVTSTKPPSWFLNKWVHVAFVAKADDSLKIYLNGVLDASDIVNGALSVDPVEPFFVGADITLATFMNANIAHFRVFHAALTAAEITKIMNEVGR